MTPTRSYFVCATPRSGSTLLCALLDQTGIAGHPEEYFEALRHSGVPRRPHEYFDPDRHANIIERLAFRELPDGSEHTPSDLWDPGSYGRYIDWTLEQGTTDNGVFGAKLMWGYLGDFADLLRGIEGTRASPCPTSWRAPSPACATSGSPGRTRCARPSRSGRRCRRRRGGRR